MYIVISSFGSGIAMYYGVVSDTIRFVRRILILFTQGSSLTETLNTSPLVNIISILNLRYPKRNTFPTVLERSSQIKSFVDTRSLIPILRLISNQRREQIVFVSTCMKTL